ncbi:MAG: acetyl-coenzyme A synthetase N-terminal domain-containing protein [Candidatus Bathyarchaeia archaeon]
MEQLLKVLPTSKNIHPDINVLKAIYRQSLEDPESFWRKVAEELFWYEKKVLHTSPYQTRLMLLGSPIGKRTSPITLLIDMWTVGGRTK